MSLEPGLGGPPDPALLLRRHHLERVAEPRTALRLHLAEDEPAPAPGDHIELVASGPDVRAEDPVAAQAVPERRAPLLTPAASCVPHTTRLRASAAHDRYGFAMELT